MQISTNASYTLAEIISSVKPDSIPFFFQLYVNKDRSASEALLKDAEKNGIKGVWFTIDGPVQGKRGKSLVTSTRQTITNFTFSRPQKATNASKSSQQPTPKLQ
jgi:isopentenyl diphosphate isomerase/L-lactate dehydrogenase-like FMN-dependent dehydrogenase